MYVTIQPPSTIEELSCQTLLLLLPLMAQLTLLHCVNVCLKICKSVTNEMVNLVNSFTDAEAQENYINNLITYTHILKTGKFKLSSYFDAVRYCGFRIIGKSIIDAYALTFPDRYRNHLQNGVSQHDLYTYASCYIARELVTKIMEQQMIPVYISHQHRSVL